MRSPRMPLLIVWLAAIVAGYAVVNAHRYTPGPAAEPLSDWPADSVVSRRRGRPTAVVFVHAKCPCTKATYAELRAAKQFTDFDLVAVGFAPYDDWQLPESELPGATWVRDDGQVATKFGAHTSGQVLLFDGDGKLLFRGGVTGSRGHEGDNPGLDAFVAHLGGSPAPLETPVFGCTIR